MWEDILKEMGYGGSKDVERKIVSLTEMGDQMSEYRAILSSFEFQKGFDEDAAEDIAEAAKLLDKVIDLISGFGR